MAAPLKPGLDYFPYDIDLDQDDKLGMIIAEYGVKGELFYTKLLAYTYKNHGYYFEYKEDVLLRFLRRYNYCGFSVSFIKEIVPRLVKWGLLNETVFNSSQVLTSDRIQKTWLDATYKRVDRSFVKKYWLIGIPDSFKEEETGLMMEVIDKRKESKVNQSKGESTGHTPNFFKKNGNEESEKGMPAGNFIAPDWDAVRNYFLSKKRQEWSEDFSHTQAQRFFNHYKKHGWKSVAGAEIVDWAAAANSWMLKDFNDSKGQNNPSRGTNNKRQDQERIDKDKKNHLFINDIYSDFLNEIILEDNIPSSIYSVLENYGLLKVPSKEKSSILNKCNGDNDLVMKYCVVKFFKELKNNGRVTVFDLSD